jgi:RNA polymerase sigma factor (TIGR02999 family)
MTDSEARITTLLAEARAGREGALDEVMEIVYSDLCRMADRQLRRRSSRDPAGATLEPAALVNETFLKLIKLRMRYDSRGHFFAVATRVMLQVLMDYYRARGAVKRGGGWARVTISDADGDLATEPSVEIPEFVEALRRLETLDPRAAEVTKLRAVWGLTVPETAAALGVSRSTVEREWRFACKWLARRLRGPNTGRS